MVDIATEGKLHQRRQCKQRLMPSVGAAFDNRVFIITCKGAGEKSMSNKQKTE